MTRKLASYFTDYAEYHSTSGNVACHYVGIPLIVVSLIGLASLVTFGNSSFEASLIRPDLGFVVVLLAMSYYIYLDWKIAISFFIVLMGCYFIGRALPLPVLIGMQVVGWPVQYIGHLHYEKNSPAFYKNLAHTLIGPLWIFAKAIGYTKAE